jgi:predicted  nucleic acid-binding Zn-ribbon protein
MPRLPTPFLLLVLCLALLRSASAQDAAQLQKLYEDTLVQLQQSQDRKNQLANENAKLLERIAELEKEVRSLRSLVDRAELMAAQYSAFRTFLNRFPALSANFRSHSEASNVPERPLPPAGYEFFDPNWPFSAITAGGGGT